jgi:ribose transport system permease protein
MGIEHSETQHTLRHRINNDAYINLFMLVVLAAFILIASFVVPSFFSAGSFLNILAQQSYLIIMGVMVTFLLLTGNFDLSVGSVASCAAVLSVYFCQPTEGSASELGMNTGFGLPVAAAMILALVVCLGIGALNALFIVKYRIASVIVTLGTMYIARGIARVVAQGAQRNLGLPPSFTKLGLTSFGDIGLPVVIMLVVVAVTLIVEKKTGFGRRMYHIGANKDAAEISGIRVGRQLVSLYMMSALMAGFAGLMIASKFKSGSSYAADGYEFDALAATILGGTSIRGGSGSIIGLLIGVFIFGTLSTCLNQLGLPPASQTVAKGIVLVIAVVVQQFAITRRNRKA